MARKDLSSDFDAESFRKVYETRYKTPRDDSMDELLAKLDQAAKKDAHPKPSV